MKDGGPAFTTIPCKCGDFSVIRQGHQWLCAKHYRFGQMRANAKRNWKKVPTEAELEQMSALMICADCERPLNWRGKDGKSTVASLQHYRDGTMALVCRSCNTRHAFMRGDSFRGVPPRHKFCPHCETVKAFEEFATDNGRSGEIKLKSWCRECSRRAWHGWNERKTA